MTLEYSWDKGDFKIDLSEFVYGSKEYYTKSLRAICDILPPDSARDLLAKMKTYYTQWYDSIAPFYEMSSERESECRAIETLLTALEEFRI